VPPARTPVEAPPVAAPPVGLLRSAVVTEDGQGARWAASGITFESEACGPSGIADPCTPGAGWELDPSDGTELVVGDTFVVWAADRCSTMDNGRDGEARARRRLSAWQGFQIERELWDGAMHRAGGHDGKFLADAEADGTEVISATPIAVRDALAALEEHLAANVPQGMFHAHEPAAPRGCPHLHDPGHHRGAGSWLHRLGAVR
jgi:hypothetical protein